MTKEQKDKVSRFYELLANALPLEGRDYRIDFAPLPDGKVSARVVGLNKIGMAFSDHVAEFWAKFGPGK